MRISRGKREDSDGRQGEVCGVKKRLVNINPQPPSLTHLPRLEVTGLMDLAGLKDLKLFLGVARWLEEVVELEMVAVE